MNIEKRLFDYLTEQAERFPQEQAYGHKVNGQWTYYSTRQVKTMADQMSMGLMALGLQPGDKVGTVVYKTRPEWIVLDFALMQIGVLNVPMYPTISAREYEYILNEAEVKYCFVGDGDLYDKLTDAQAKSPALRQIFTFDDHHTAPRWDSLLPAAEDPAQRERLEALKAWIRPEDLATIIYTSGTTGNPKGVMLTHQNIVFNVESMRKLIPMDPGQVGLSFLPVSHIFERAVLYAYTAYGASVAFTTAENLGGETGDLQGVKPHFFSTVPRLLEKVYDKIYGKGLELKGPKRAIFFWAMRLTDHWDFDQKPGWWLNIKRKIADRLIFSKWRAALGGRVVGILTGANACPMPIMRVFNAAGINVREGYGMTEAAPAISFNRFPAGGARLGSVGQLLDGVEVRIDHGGEYRPGEGEIWATGPGIMLGYYKQADQTDQTIQMFEGKRWLCTGDIGRLESTPDGRTFLYITDRKKELLKTSGGKYVAPAPIEAALRAHRLVEQSMVVGENLKFVSALIIPSVDGLKEWCHKHQIEFTNLSDMLKDNRVVRRFEMLVERINEHLSHTEQIKKIALLDAQWEPVKNDGSASELTPTLKLKRRVIMEKFKANIDNLYS